MSHVLGLGGKLLANAFTLTYGFVTLAAVLVYTVFQRQTWLGRSKSEDSQYRAACHELWSLAAGSGTICHDFLTLPDGLQLHYLSQRKQSQETDALLIYLHGFPDSAHIWARQLRDHPPSPRTKVIALDLPGCGGSDDLKAYGPNEILNALAEAIQQLKDRFLGTRSNGVPPPQARKCILVGHDWGGALSYRIAAETIGLVDNVVIVNSIYPVQAAASIRMRLSRGFKAYTEWMFRFYEFSKLDEAAEELGPAFAQLFKSSYIFLVTLPLPLARIFPAVSTALIKLCHQLTHSHCHTVSETTFATSLALSSGPSTQECTSTTAEGLTYGPSVLARSQTSPAGDWDQRVRLYKEGAGMVAWQPSYTGASPNMQHVHEKAGVQATTKRLRLHVEEHQKFKCPVNIIYGMTDVALDPRITLDGIEEYFIQEPESEAAQRIVRLPNCGHWALTEGAGAKALQDVLIQLSR